MKNIEKYTNTKDALEAYNSLNLKNLPFDEWLKRGYVEPRVPTLLEAAEAVANSWFDDDKTEVFGMKICDLVNAIDLEKCKPVRNFDKYKTADDAHAGFIEFCRKYTCGKCRFVNKVKPVGCAIAWLYDEAVNEEAK